MPSPLAELLEEVAASSLELPEEITASEWSRRHYRLSAEVASAEGPWNPVAYQADLIDVFCLDAGPEEIIVQKSARIGYTSSLLASIAYAMGHRRRHVIVYMPNDGDARDFVKDSIDPMIRDCAPLSALIEEIQDKRSGDTTSLKTLGGKELRVAGAVSPARFRRITSDFVLLDELDAYSADVGNEGDALSLAGRANRISPFKRTIAGSTPTDVSTSLVAREITRCMRVFEFAVQCPCCGRPEVLRWENMKWEEGGRGVSEIELRAATVYYKSSCCGGEWRQDRLHAAVAAGFWRDEDGAVIDTAPDRPPILVSADGRQVPWPHRIGFRIWTAYSLWYPWRAIVREWLSAQGDVLKLKVCTNHTLGEVWRDEEVANDPEELRERTTDLNVLPAEVYGIYASVDVQDGWLSCLVVGFGAGEATWLIERREFHGGNDKFDSPAWRDLYAWVKSRPEWERWKADGEEGELGRPLGLTGVVLDSGAYTDTVYRASYRVPHRRTIVVKGANGVTAPVVKLPPSRATVREGARTRTRPLYMVGVHQAKTVVAHRLAKSVVYADTLPEEVFDELAAERLVKVKSGGRWVIRWQQDNARNEALDCLVYALVLRRLHNPVWLGEAGRPKEEDVEQPEPEPDPEPDRKPPNPAAQAREIRRTKKARATARNRQRQWKRL